LIAHAGGFSLGYDFSDAEQADRVWFEWER
jgi:hypothetical protein